MAASTSTSESNVVVAAGVPWPDLPEALTEEIIERLYIPDYIRFGAVCRRWRSIQRDHRLRHSPSSPPALSLPWFIPYRPRQESVVCSVGLLSPEERRLQIPFSPTYLASIESEEAALGTEDAACSSLPHGWLIFDNWTFFGNMRHSYEFSLLNPITGAQISLPYLGESYEDFKATVSPPPRSDVFVLTDDGFGNSLHLYRHGNPSWTYLGDNQLDSGVHMAVASVIYYEGKFYCFRLGMDFMVFDIDCLVEDQIKPHFLEMDQSLLPNDYPPWPDGIEERLEIFLVESDGKMLLVCKLFGYYQSHKTRRFELFESDLSNRRWVKVVGLGDHALLIYQKFAVSLVAADVGVKRNCIYVLYVLDPPKTEEEPPVPWKMFDLSTGELADASLPFPPPPSTHLMFVPSIY